MGEKDNPRQIPRQVTGIPFPGSAASDSPVPFDLEIITLMDPYAPPSTAPDDSLPLGQRGQPCLKCGSANTGTEVALRNKPGLLTVMLFGWVFLLIRGAFAMRNETCRDCGAIRRYKTTGSWLALIVLVLIAALFALSFFAEPV